MSLLRVAGLAVAYGGIEAVRGIDLTVEQGELVCLIGANGAGKTTTLKALAGLLPPARGQVSYRGEAITGLPAHRLVRQGIVLVPEGRGIFGRLTVAENLQLGAHIREDTDAVAHDLAQVFSLFPLLSQRREQRAGTLSGGEQQMLAIGRALMSRPQLLLLDEPSLGLAPLIVQKIFEIIKQIAAQGVTLLLVEQNARMALAASDRAYVMESGAISLSGPAAELLHDPKVRAAYLGEVSPGAS